MSLMRRPLVVVQKIELRPDARGLRMTESIEDLEGPPPGRPGGVAVAGTAMGVAEPEQGGRHLVAVAEVVPGVKGVLVAGDRLVVATELVVGVTEAVPRVGPPR